MSWSAAGEGASGAAEAGSAGSSLGSAAGNVGSAASPAAEGVGAAGGAGGYSLNATQAPQQSPSFMDNAMSGLEKFQKGSQQTMPEAWRSRGLDNPGTYGYIASKLPMGGGAQQAPNMTTNISYQQPENTYLKKRGY